MEETPILPGLFLRRRGDPATSVYLSAKWGVSSRASRSGCTSGQEQTCPFPSDGSNRPWALIPPSHAW